MTIFCYAVHMENVLREIGLQDNEATVYLQLLKNPLQTAQQLATQTDIKRTNVYRILDALLEQELIIKDDSPVSRFSAAEPQSLQKLLQRRQNTLKQTASSLSAVMPQLRSQYSLSLNKPGVVYMTGDDGLERLLFDMVNSQTEVLLVAGDEPRDADTRSRFRELIMQRKQNNVHTRALFHGGEHQARITHRFSERGFDVRFIGTTPFDSEVVIYEDSVAFSVYDPSLIITIITNKDFANTMRTLFEQLWCTANV